MMSFPVATNDEDFKKLKQILHDINTTELKKEDLEKYQKILTNKLEKKCGEGFIEAVTNGNGLVQNIPDAIRNRILLLGNRYCDRLKGKYRREVNFVDDVDRLIDAYSCYKALKVIHEVYKELEKKVKDKEKTKSVWNLNEKNEFLGALDVARLAKSHKKFTLRVKRSIFNKELKMGQQIKAADYLNQRRVMGMVDKKDKNYKADTPFGNIQIRCKMGMDNKETRLIDAIISGTVVENPTYVAMSLAIDKALDAMEDESKKTLINSMTKYIKTIITIQERENIDKLLENLKPDPFHGFDSIKDNTTKEKGKGMTAALCGCLLFAESAEIRNPTRGKWEKYALQQVETLIDKGYKNPFGVVFAGQKPSKTEMNEPSENKGKLYTPAETKEKTSGISTNVGNAGGLRQSRWLIRDKVHLSELLKPNENQLFNQFQQLLSDLNDEQMREAVNWISYNYEKTTVENLKEQFKEWRTKVNMTTESFPKLGSKTKSKQMKRIIKATTKSLETCKEGTPGHDYLLENAVEILGGIDTLDNDTLEQLKRFYLLCGLCRTREKTYPSALECLIRIDDIPDVGDLKTTKNYLLKCRAENRRKLSELNSDLTE